MITDYPITIVNGVVNRYLSVLDRGLAYGDGVFETMRCINGDIPLWRLHHDRLQLGLSALDIPLKVSALAIQMQLALESIKAADLKQAVIKLMVTRGEGGRGYQIPEQPNPNLITIISPLFPDILTDTGVEVNYCNQLLSPQPLSGIKTLNQLAYVLASQERSGSDYAESLLFNHQNQLIEATARNVFLVDSHAQLLTPKLDYYGIEGVMRRLIIETIAPQLHIDVKQATITKTDIANAKELFLTNSVTHIWPVIRCQHQTLEQGPLTLSIKNHLMNFLQNQTHLSYRRHTEMHVRLEN